MITELVGLAVMGAGFAWFRKQRLAAECKANGHDWREQWEFAWAMGKATLNYRCARCKKRAY